MGYYLGVVGTAKISKMALANEKGILAHIIAPPLSMRVNPNIRQSLTESVQYLAKTAGISCEDIMGGLVSACFAMSGLFFKGDEASLNQIIDDIGFTGKFKRVICEDTHAILAANFLCSGGVVICSTGANVFLKSANANEVIRVDGWGSDLGDDGGGYYLGRICLRTLLRGADKRMEISPVLEDYVLKHAGLFDVESLVQWSYNVRSTVNWRSEIADLAIPLVRAAEDGDPLAAGIVSEGAGELFRTLQTGVRLAAANPVFEDMKYLPVILEGGIFENCAIYRNYFKNNIGNIPAGNLKLDIIHPEYKSVVGALALAASEDRFVDNSRGVVEIIRASADDKGLRINC